MTELSVEDEAVIQNKKNLLVDNNNNPIPPEKKITNTMPPKNYDIIYEHWTVPCRIYQITPDYQILLFNNFMRSNYFWQTGHPLEIHVCIGSPITSTPVSHIDWPPFVQKALSGTATKTR